MTSAVEDLHRWRGIAKELRALAEDIRTASGKAEVLQEAERLEKLADEVEASLKAQDSGEPPASN